MGIYLEFLYLLLLILLILYVFSFSAVKSVGDAVPVEPELRHVRVLVLGHDGQRRKYATAAAVEWEYAADDGRKYAADAGQQRRNEYAAGERSGTQSAVLESLAAAFRAEQCCVVTARVHR